MADPVPDCALDALTPADVEWLDRMADVLPQTMPVDGSSWWRLTWWDPWITMETVRG